MTELPVTSYGRKVVGEKSRLISLILSFFLFAGLGIIYAGNFKKGLIFFIADIIMLIVVIGSYVWMCCALALTVVSTSYSDLMGILVPSILIWVAALISFILRVLAMIFGYQMCKENNKLWIDYLESDAQPAQPETPTLEA